jgi:hypothetical protein
MKPKTVEKSKTLKPHEKPTLTKLTPEQAKRKIASSGSVANMKKMLPPDAKKSA